MLEGQLMERVMDLIEANAMHIIVIMMLVVILAMATNRMTEVDDNEVR